MITFRYIYLQIKLHKKKIFMANLLAIIITLITIPIPLFIPFIIDEVISGKEGSFIPTVNWFVEINSPVYYIVIVFVLMLLLQALSSLIGLIRSSYLDKVIGDTRLAIRQKLLYHLKNVSMSEFDMLGSGEISSKMSVDVGTVMTFTSKSMSIGVTLLKLIVVSIILFYLQWQLALIIMILNPLIWQLMLKFYKKGSAMLKERSKVIAKFNNSLVESLELFNQVRVQNREENFFKMVTDEATEVRDKSYEYDIKTEKVYTFGYLMYQYTDTILKMLALYFVLNKDMSIGDMMAILIYAGMMNGSINQLLDFMKKYYDTKEAMDRLNDIMRLKQEPKFEMKQNPFHDKESVHIEIKNLSFGYDDKKQIFKNFNLDIKKGEKVAIIGETGSGKSTLANILMGLYPITEGEIFYNGVEIKEIGYETVRENVGLILQSPLMFNASLRYNLSLGRDYSDEMMYKSLKTAQLYKFVDGLPERLDTIVGKNGTKLSGGQRQRLSIARVLLDNPKVLIFDESTSSLDMDTEDRLLEALKEYIKDKTIITIAHRQTTIDKSDRIIKLESKKIED